MTLQSSGRLHWALLAFRDYHVRTCVTMYHAYHEIKQARLLAHERKSKREVCGSTDSTSADTAPASMVSVDDQVKVGAPHCSGYGKRNQGVVCSTLSCAHAHQNWHHLG